ncbi:hypothetical protein AVEN_270058-1 [Araneus ventricosus]|uniref:Uncharacterized protein n=1 Tax=Araneus ventricosus TaxID=182803 RepID=A0A4Y2LFU3_ARAVE|nr:hypothetical protein AVEN_270058-1 [Araneus ventricosus]
MYVLSGMWPPRPPYLSTLEMVSEVVVKTEEDLAVRVTGLTCEQPGIFEIVLRFMHRRSVVYIATDSEIFESVYGENHVNCYCKFFLMCYEEAVMLFIILNTTADIYVVDFIWCPAFYVPAL